MLRRAEEALLNALYPRRVACFCCDEDAALNGQGLCAGCEARLAACAMPPLPELDGTASALQYGEAAEGMVHRFKYGGHTYLADFFAPLMLLPEGWRVNAIVPVPLYPGKQRMRGYNQSLLLAERIAEREGLPLQTDWLVRSRDTGTQTRFSAKERRQNVAGAFGADPACAGGHILLIDDVITTGSTVRACAAALRQAGAARIYALSACRA